MIITIRTTRRSREGAFSVSNGLVVSRSMRATIFAILSLVFVEIAALIPSSSHSDITANSDSATLFSNSLTQESTFVETRKLLCTVYNKRLRLDFQSPIEGRIWRGRRFMHLSLVTGNSGRSIVVILGLLIEVEAEEIPALMANRKIRENEVARLMWSIQVGHS